MPRLLRSLHFVDSLPRLFPILPRCLPVTRYVCVALPTRSFTLFVWLLRFVARFTVTFATRLRLLHALRCALRLRTLRYPVARSLPFAFTRSAAPHLPFTFCRTLHVVPGYLCFTLRVGFGYVVVTFCILRCTILRLIWLLRVWLRCLRYVLRWIYVVFRLLRCPVVTIVCSTLFTILRTHLRIYSCVCCCYLRYVYVTFPLRYPLLRFYVVALPTFVTLRYIWLLFVAHLFRYVTFVVCVVVILRCDCVC